LGKTVKLPNNFKPVEIPLNIQNKLKSYTYVECLLILTHALDVTKVVSVSPFNIDSVMQGFSYNYSRIQEIDVEDLGETLLIGLDNTEFPKKNVRGYMKFIDPVGRMFVCPIEGNYINTNYFRDSRIDKSMFNSQIVEAVALIATFYSLRNGAISQLTGTEAGKQVLNFERLLATNYANSFDYVSEKLMSWFEQLQCPDPRGWNHMTLHGLAFAHQLYYSLAKICSNDEQCIEHLSMITSCIIEPVYIQGRTVKFFDVKDSSYVINGCPLSLPMILNGQKADLMNKQAGLDQAWYVLQQCRSVRGVDKTEKGSLSRRSYIDININPGMAEIIYTATNIRRFLNHDSVIVLSDVGKSSGTVLEFLNALVMNDYKGLVYMSEVSTIKNVLVATNARNGDTTDVLYKFGAGEFKIVLSPVDHMIYTQSWVRQKDRYTGSLPKEAIIFDFRILTNATYDKKRLQDFEVAVELAYKSRLAQYEMFAYPIVMRCPTYTGLFEEKERIKVVTGVELHNLVQWVCVNCKPDETIDPWWYDCNVKNMEEIFSASILANIGPTVVNLIRVGPLFLLKRYGFRSPRLLVSGLKKMSMNQIAYSSEEIMTAMSHGPGMLLQLFNNSNPVTQGVMLSTDSIREQLEMNDRSASPDRDLVIRSKSIGNKMFGMDRSENFDPNSVGSHEED